jgi:hypothetical protein
MSVNFEETTWTITRQAPVGAGARAEGDNPPVASQSGLWFRSAKGEALFFPMPYEQLPSQDALPDLKLEDIHKMIVAARKQK